MFSELLSFPVIAMGTSCIIALVSLTMGSDKGLETAGVIAAIGGTGFQAQSRLELKAIQNRSDNQYDYD